MAESSTVAPAAPYGPVAVGLVTGAVAALVVPLWAALVWPAWSVVGLYVPWVRGLATAGGVALIAAGCASVVYGQEVHRYLSGSNWPSSFTSAGNLIWLGVVLLLADAAISAFRLRLPRPLGSRALQSAQPPPRHREPGTTDRQTTDRASTAVDPAVENPATERRDEGTERAGQVREEPAARCARRGGQR